MNGPESCNNPPVTGISNIVDAINTLRDADSILCRFVCDLHTSNEEKPEMSLPDFNTFQDIWGFLPEFIDMINGEICSNSDRIRSLVIGTEVAEKHLFKEGEVKENKCVNPSSKVVILSEKIDSLQKTVAYYLGGVVDGMGMVYASKELDPVVASETVFGNVWPTIASDLRTIASDIIKYKNIISEVIYDVEVT